MLSGLFVGPINAESLRRTFMFRFGNEMQRYAYIPKSDWYNKSDLDKDNEGRPLTGWNKLYGFAGFNHHEFSARLVWQPKWDQYGYFDIYLYVYNEGEWIAKKILTVEGNKLFLCGLKAEDDCYLGYVNNLTNNIHGEGCTCIWAEKTPHFIRLEPYFGGRSFASKTIILYLWNPITFMLFGKYIKKKLNIH